MRAFALCLTSLAIVATASIVTACGDDEPAASGPTTPDASSPEVAPPGDASTADNFVPPLGDGGPIVTVHATSREAVMAILRQPDDKIVFVARHMDHSSAVVFRVDANGVLDPTFGTGGRVLISRGPFAYSAALQADGKILVAGGQGILRLNANGTLDRSFETPTSIWYIETIALQSDGKLIGASRSASGMQVWRFLANGDLDTTFGDQGARIIDFTNPLGETVSKIVLIEPDDKIVILGRFRTNPEQLALTRLSKDGEIDTGFGDQGRAVTAFGASCNASRMGRLADGKLLLVGSVWDSGNNNIGICVARFNGDGTPDDTFTTAAIAMANVTRVEGLALRSDGTFVVGTTTALHEFSAAGVPGVVTPLALPKQQSQEIIALMPDGTIIGGGSVKGPTNEETSAAWRIKTDKTLDTTFAASAGGLLQVPFEGTKDHIRGLAIQPDGTTYAAGFGGGAGMLTRFTPAGALDTSFGKQGFVSFEDQIWRVAVQPGTNRILVNASFGIVAYTAAGVKDGTYAPSQSYGDSWTSVQGMAFDPAGRLLVTGYSGGYSGERLTVVRFTPDGAADTAAFNAPQGYFTQTVPNGGDRGYAIAAQADNKVVVAGTNEGTQGAAGMAFVARFTEAGALDATFAGDTGTANGYLKFNATDYPYNGVLTVAVQPDGKIIAAGAGGNSGMHYDFYPSTEREMFVVRLGTDGKVDTSFGTNGVINGPTYAGAEARSMTLLPDGRIVIVGRRASVRAKVDMVAWRFTPAGQPDATFGTNGVYVAPFDDDATAFAVAPRPDGKLMAGGFAANGIYGHDLALLPLP